MDVDAQSPEEARKKFAEMVSVQPEDVEVIASFEPQANPRGQAKP